MLPNEFSTAVSVYLTTSVAAPLVKQARWLFAFFLRHHPPIPHLAPLFIRKQRGSRNPFLASFCCCFFMDSARSLLLIY
jgi:hypothetical protein